MDTKIPKFRRCVIQNFPFIEQDFDALTDYGLVSKIVKYLNDIINQTNTTTENMQALQTAFNTLKNYVDHYFDNLDVQEEINNKLDEMAEQGVLADIISQYLNSTAIFGYDSVADMKSAENLVAGSFARTLGYYSANDGGGALYKIRAITNDDVIDEAFLVEMGDSENNLVAELIIDNNTVNIKQLGGRSQATDGTKYDIKNYIYKYINYIADKPNRCRLYIPAGVWTSTAMTITNPNGFDIFGDFGYSEYRFDSTIITTMSDNQTLLLNLGTNEGTYLKNFNLANILFSTYDWAWDSTDKAWKPNTNKKVTNQVVNMLYCIHGKLENIMFNHCVGQCLKISACWENIYTYITYRFVSNPLSSIMCFGSDQSYGQYASVSSSDFQKLYFEKCHGNLIEVKGHANVANNHFGVINFEPNRFNYDNAFTYATIDASNLPASLNHYYMIALTEDSSNMVGNKIDSIELNSMAIDYFTYNGNNYAYDSIFFTGDGYQYFNNVIGSIVCTDTYKDVVLFKNTKSNKQFSSADSAMDIQSVLIDSNYDFVFNVDGLFPVVHVGGELKGKGSVTKTTSTIIPFYECLQNCRTNGVANNCLTSDSGALNKTKLCLRPWGFQTFILGGTIVTATNKIYVRAKLDDSTTYYLLLRNEDDSQQQALKLDGNGDWNWYEFDLDSNMAILGQKCWFKSQNADNRNILLDSFMFA